MKNTIITTCGNSNKLAKKTLGWKPKTSLKLGLNQTIKYFNQL